MTAWRTVSLGEALEFAYGKALPKSARVANGHVPVYGSNGVTGWHNESLIKGPTVIVGRKGSAGAVQYVEEPCFPIDTTYYVKSRLGFEFDPRFLFYLLRRKDLPRLRTATGVPGLTREDVYRESISFPPLEEQRRIVDLLSRAEGIVRLRREAQAKAQAIIPALFFDLFGDPATNPKGWPTAPLSEVAQVISGIAKGRKLAADEGIELPYMRVANVKDGYLDLGEVKTIAIKRTEVDKLLIQPGDLLMTEGGDPDKLGRAALWSGEIDHCVHQNHIFKVRSDRSRVLPSYLRALAGSTYGKAYFLSVAKKTTGIASINKTQLSAFPVVLPPMTEQEVFADRAAAVDSITLQQSEALKKAEASFQALLARAFGHQDFD
ncbi:MAG TPA: restriction endonuclease subunit S [Ottowia sp.]|nr:restriction endonuclease subunit S [Ottowia sp.]